MSSITRKKILIITPDLVGPVNNGGIGTFVYELVKSQQSVHNFTIIIGLRVADQTWRGVYSKMGVRTLSINQIGSSKYNDILGADLETNYAWHIATFLKDSNEYFDEIILQDWKALGFFVTRDKRLGLAHTNTRITTVVHSPSCWSAEGNGNWNSGSVKNQVTGTFASRMNFRESYQIQNSDVAIYPSTYMMNWTRDRGWNTPTDSRVMLNPYTRKFESPTQKDPEKFGSKRIAFFSRLETRKGLEIFLDAIALLPESLKSVLQVDLVGKLGLVNGEECTTFINRWNSENDVAISLYNDFSSELAIKHLLETDPLVVHPSLRDNLPYSVLESKIEGLQIIATNVGGTSEILGPDDTCQPKASEIANLILRKLTSNTIPDKPSPSRSEGNDQWAKFLSETNTSTYNKFSSEEPPRVLVVIPYFNSGDFFQETIDSVSKQDYKNFKVLVWNCGSNKMHEGEKFAHFKSQFEERDNFFFEEVAYLTVQEARNQMAVRMESDFLIFLDSDNVLIDDHALSRLASAIRSSNTDVITSGLIGFESSDSPKKVMPHHLIWMPLGNFPSLGWHENVFGDTFGIIRTPTFLKIGGFSKDARFFEDWNLYLRMSLAGYDLDVLPMPQLWYRHLKSSRRTETIAHEAYASIAKIYDQHLPSSLKTLFFDGVMPLMDSGASYHGSSHSQNVVSEQIRLIASKILPVGSKRRSIVLKLITHFAK